ncbi:MAG: homocysteine S-methyltransferase family protein [Deltaproteobacteria bacterium]|nr:homocysteine S-methyltransferase family protein [Deltaproteobacteria bacterium]
MSQRAGDAGDGLPDPVILDGAMGTELIARGAMAPAPLWSAWATLHRPELVAQIHREYAAAGATVHTANTFRAKRRCLPEQWREAAERAVELARAAVPPWHRVAGSIAPLEDCYRPDLSPAAEARAEHRELVQLLAATGVDLLLCETFAHPGEALVAVEEAARTGVETWVAFTAGPRADLLLPEQIEQAAERCVAAGAAACLVNCVPALESMRFLERLTELGVPCGVYANAGDKAEGIGWGAGPPGPARYADLACRWRAAGASIIGGCCGTGPEHVRAVAAALRAEES